MKKVYDQQNQVPHLEQKFCINVEPADPPKYHVINYTEIVFIDPLTKKDGVGWKRLRQSVHFVVEKCSL